MTFIELTMTEGSPGKRVLINAAQIASVRSRILGDEELGIQVELKNGHYIDCREHFQAIRELFERAGVEVIR